MLFGLALISDKMVGLDIVVYLLDYIPAKVGRFAMTFNLGSAVPFLDYQIVRFSVILPLPMKWRIGKGKDFGTSAELICVKKLSRPIQEFLKYQETIGHVVHESGQKFHSKLKGQAEKVLGSTAIRTAWNMSLS